MKYETECPQCGAKIEFCAEYCAACQYSFSSRLERDWEDRDWAQVADWVESLEGLGQQMVTVPREVAKVLGYFHNVDSRYIGNATYFPETARYPAEVRVIETRTGGILTKITGLPPVA